MDDIDGPAVTVWRAKALQFLEDGTWPPMSDLKWQWFEDAQVLTEIGRVLHDQALPMVAVRIPTELAQRAAAAWARDNQTDEVDENATERAYRRRAGALALIGLAIEERGVPAVDGVDVELSADLVVNAIEAIEAA